MKIRSASLQRRLRGVAVAAVVALALTQAAPARANTASEAGLGAVSAIFSLVYGPVKIVYAVVGSTVAGLSWVLSGGDGDVAGPILNAAVRGDYVITPSHLRGEQSLEFVGRPPEDQALRQTAADW